MRLFGGPGRNYPRQTGEEFVPGRGGMYPMIPLKGLSAIANNARLNGNDIDNTPIRYAYPINGSDVLEIQLKNGLENGAMQGIRALNGIPVNWLAFNTLATMYRPGQRTAHSQVGGFVPMPVSPYNIANMVAQTAGSEPVNPGGPGQSAGGVPSFEGW